jgi:hypothetical protein
MLYVRLLSDTKEMVRKRAREGLACVCVYIYIL